MAREADARIAKAMAVRSPAFLGIKDLFATKDVRTTACSKISAISCRHTNPPSPRSFGRDGAVMLGKLNNASSRLGSSNETSVLRSGGQSVAARRRQHHAGAGRLVRRLGIGGCGAVCMGATATTPAARSASRLRLPRPSAFEADLLPLVRAGASSRLHLRSIRPGRSPVPCGMRRS